MKFEKFLKEVGTHGLVYQSGNDDRWLICDGVGMKIPTGVNNLLGSGETPEKTSTLIEAIINADTDDRVMLTRAEIPAAGKPKDIVRIFSDNLDIEVGISNANFGLLEKSDINLAEIEIEDDILIDTKYLLILDRTGDEVIGFIEGVKENSKN